MTPKGCPAAGRRKRWPASQRGSDAGGGGCTLNPAPQTHTTSGALGAWATASRAQPPGGLATPGTGLKFVPPSVLTCSPSRQAAKTSFEAPATPVAGWKDTLQVREARLRSQFAPLVLDSKSPEVVAASRCVLSSGSTLSSKKPVPMNGARASELQSCPRFVERRTPSPRKARALPSPVPA